MDLFLSKFKLLNVEKIFEYQFLLKLLESSIFSIQDVVYKINFIIDVFQNRNIVFFRNIHNFHLNKLRTSHIFINNHIHVLKSEIIFNFLIVLFILIHLNSIFFFAIQIQFMNWDFSWIFRNKNNNRGSSYFRNFLSLLF
jgi:hypothetical protein